jgi:hypothetical protein
MVLYFQTIGHLPADVLYRFKFHDMTAQVSRGPMSNSVSSVLVAGSPAELFQSAVESVAIVMAALLAITLWPIECRQDQAADPPDLLYA